MRNKYTALAFRTALLYLVLAGAWILFSDTLLVKLVSDPATIRQWSVFKGWAFVLITASLLYFELRRQLRRLEKEAAERRQAEKALRESEERFRTAIEFLPVPIGLANLNGEILHCNQAFTEHFGYRREEIPTMAEWFRCAYPDAALREKYIRQWDADVAESVRDGTSTPKREYRVTCKDGTQRDVAISMRQSGGLYIATFDDVTQRREAEAALRQSESRFQTMAETVGEVFWLRPPDSRSIHYVSPAFEKIWGRNCAEVYATPSLWIEAIHPEDQPRVLAALKQLAQGRPYDIQYRIRRPDGTGRWIGDRGYPQFDRDGEVALTSGVCSDITERKRTEQSLADELIRKRVFIEQSRDGIYVLDLDGKLCDANPRFAQMLGYDAGEMTRLHVWDWNCQFNREQLLEHIQLVDELGDSFETRHRRKDGTVVEVEVSRNSVVLGGRKLLLCVCRDISRRKQTEARMRHLNDVLVAVRGVEELMLRERDPQRLLDEACKILVSTRGYRLVWYGQIEPNSKRLVPVARAGSGTDYVDAISVTWDESPTARGPTGTAARKRETCVCHDTANDPAFAPWKELALSHGYLSAAAVPVIQSSRVFGVLTVYADHANAFNQDDLQLLNELAGNLAFALQSIEHETQRRLGETRLHLLREALESAANAIAITDRGGEIIWVNAAFGVLTGYSTEEVIGQNPRLLKSGKHDAAFYRNLWKTILAGEVWRGEMLNRRKDGSMYSEDNTITPVLNEQGEITHFISVKQDITERQRLEEQFRQAQKMEAVGQLAGGVAHDFNNILAATLMHLGLLQTEVNLDPQMRMSLADLETEIQRGANLTRQLLMFSRRQVMQKKTVNLNQIVTNMLKMLQRLLGEHVEVLHPGAETAAYVEADAGMMEQVVLNLSVNARDAMPQGGRLTLAVTTVEIGQDPAPAGTDARTGSFVCLSVTDTGCGMDEKTRQRIFEPFFTTKEVGKGTGLGLATVHGIVKQHQGWIMVESEPERGSTFKVFFPALMHGTEEDTATSAGEIRGGTETILLVEDEATVRKLAVRTLQQHGYHILEAKTGREALQQWERHRDQIDLLFTDVVMPDGMTGLELVQTLTQAKPGLKVVISSGYSLEVTRLSEDKMRSMIYLEKPYKAASLAAAIRNCLDKK